jgi:hypothetical protein
MGAGTLGAVAQHDLSCSSCSSCCNTKKQYVDECSMVHAFVHELKLNDKQQFNRIIDDFFLNKRTEISNDILDLYYKKFNSIKSINFDKSDCFITKEGRYSIVELRGAKFKLFLRVIKHKNEFRIVNCVAIMKGVSIVAWI